VKFISKMLETFEPYVDKIEDPMLRDIGRIVVPLGSMIFVFAVLSLPFGLAGAIIDGLVAMAGVQ
jgi:hypothetical protein